MMRTEYSKLSSKYYKVPDVRSKLLEPVAWLFRPVARFCLRPVFWNLWEILPEPTLTSPWTPWSDFLKWLDESKSHFTPNVKDSKATFSILRKE